MGEGKPGRRRELMPCFVEWDWELLVLTARLILGQPKNHVFS